MAAPVILLIDDEPHVLGAIARDLKAHVQGEYRVVQAGSGADGLDAVRDLKGRGAQVALFLVDQRMPGMSGVQFLKQAVRLYPDARKVLLTAYADTDAAIASINTVGLDHYLMKPWDPPEERLYPVLDDLLNEWRARAPEPYEGIRVVGTRWSAKAHEVKEFLARNQTPYKWLDVEKSPAARALVEGALGAHPPLPVLFFPDGGVLTDPELPELAERIGLHTNAEQPFYDLIVIGAGPAGLGAAVYGASEGLRTVVIEKNAAGGQAGSSARIENYLGFPQGISGADLTRRATTQAVRFGAELLTARAVTDIRVEDPYRVVALDDGTELRCHALLLATGVRTRTLDAPGVEALTGASVFYGTAASEAVNYQGGKVFVVGGANSAGQGAVYLSRFASEVTMLIRGDSLEASMSKYLIGQIERTKNITVRVNTEVAGAVGTEHMEALSLLDRETGDTETVPADAMFLFIGAVPHTDLVADLVQRDEAGFIVTGQDLVQDGRRPKGWKPRRDPLLLETSVPGIFAAGDVRHGVVRRVASAVGQGAVAATSVHKYLETV